MMKGGVRPNLSSSSINRSPVRHSTGGSVNSSLCGDRDRRELHLASHNLSTDAGRQNVVLNVEKQNKSLSSHVRESDEQLDRTKAELRKARATIQQYERQEENLQRRLEQAHADKVAAQALGEEAADRARKLDAKLAVGLHQRGMGAVQREAKAAEALLLLKERDAELAAARREAMLLRLSVEAREEDLGLVPPGVAGGGASEKAAKQNRASVLLQVQTLRDDKARMREEAVARDAELQEEKEGRAVAEGRVRETEGSLSEAEGRLAGEQQQRAAWRETAGALSEVEWRLAGEQQHRYELSVERAVILSYVQEEAERAEERGREMERLSEEREVLADKVGELVEQQAATEADTNITSVGELVEQQAAAEADAADAASRHVQEVESARGEVAALQGQASQGASAADEDRARALTDEVGKLYADIEDLTEANQQLQGELAEAQEANDEAQEQLGRLRAGETIGDGEQAAREEALDASLSVLDTDLMARHSGDGEQAAREEVRGMHAQLRAEKDARALAERRLEWGLHSLILYRDSALQMCTRCCT
ncbi:hypothetical protein T484DRAFT_1783705 [Baffinella frigidus]|nr:hypothetical protein T484DRAFT_1783705 [Cryptophyta sp. CCMP2293]